MAFFHLHRATVTVSWSVWQRSQTDLSLSLTHSLPFTYAICSLSPIRRYSLFPLYLSLMLLYGGVSNTKTSESQAGPRMTRMWLWKEPNHSMALLLCSIFPPSQMGRSLVHVCSCNLLQRSFGCLQLQRNSKKKVILCFIQPRLYGVINKILHWSICNNQ